MRYRLKVWWNWCKNWSDGQFSGIFGGIFGFSAKPIISKSRLKEQILVRTQKALIVCLGKAIRSNRVHSVCTEFTTFFSKFLLTQYSLNLLPSPCFVLFRQKTPTCHPSVLQPEWNYEKVAHTAGSNLGAFINLTTV